MNQPEVISSVHIRPAIKAFYATRYSLVITHTYSRLDEMLSFIGIWFLIIMVSHSGSHVSSELTKSALHHDAY